VIVPFEKRKGVLTLPQARGHPICIAGMPLHGNRCSG
jgi:hypothetical protein